MPQPLQQAKTKEQVKDEQFGKTYIVRFRQHVGGSFSGLWELTLLSKSGKVEKMITDGDALAFCLENLQGEMEDDGY